MLPKKHRIDRRFFNDVFSKGQFFGGEFLTGKIMSLNSNQPTRFAVVAQKKDLRRAVDRNMLRRRVYAAIIPLLPQVKPGFAIIIFAKPGLKNTDFSSLQTMLVNLLKHHHLIND